MSALDLVTQKPVVFFVVYDVTITAPTLPTAPPVPQRRHCDSVEVECRRSIGFNLKIESQRLVLMPDTTT